MMSDLESMPARGQPGYKRARVKRFVNRLLRPNSTAEETAVVAAEPDAVEKVAAAPQAKAPEATKLVIDAAEETAAVAEEAAVVAEEAAAGVAEEATVAAQAKTQEISESATEAAKEAAAVAEEAAAAAQAKALEATKSATEAAQEAAGVAEEAVAAVAEEAVGVAEKLPVAAQAKVSETTKSATEASQAKASESTKSAAESKHEGAAKASTQFYKNSRLLFLPFTSGMEAVPPLPILDAEEERLVRSGERLRWQQPPAPGNREGRGFAVVELRANPDDVWRAISSFEKYVEFIQTVKKATAYDDPPEAPPKADNVCLWSFVVSRIRLRLDVRFTLDPVQRCAAWQLDKKSWVLHDSTGYWRVEPCDDRPGIVRVWFCVGVRLAGRVPNFVLSLVARLGLDKATRWLKGLEHTATPGK